MAERLASPPHPPAFKISLLGTATQGPGHMTTGTEQSLAQRPTALAHLIPQGSFCDFSPSDPRKLGGPDMGVVSWGAPNSRRAKTWVNDYM